MKICSFEGCNNPVWSKGACRFHAPKSPIKISKVKEKKPVAKGIVKRNQMFMEIWNNRFHYCEICNAYLGREPMSYMFDHLLEKSKYPKLKYEPDNIALVCLSCHDKKTRGFISAEYQEKINFVITKFNVS